VVKRKNRKIADSNTHGGNKRKALAKLLEKIISDGKLRGVVVSTMSLVLYQLAGQKLITAIIDTSPALLNLNMAEVTSKGFPNIKQLKDVYKKLGGAEVVESFNVDLKLTVPQQVKALKLMIKNALRLKTGPKRANLIASLMFLLLFFYFTNTGL
jgi:CRISPR/Cas system-associated protein endoribonuclease Cas2